MGEKRGLSSAKRKRFSVKRVVCVAFRGGGEKSEKGKQRRVCYIYRGEDYAGIIGRSRRW